MLVERVAAEGARSGPVTLIVFGDDHSFFSLRVRLKWTREGVRPETERGYSFRCGDWSDGPGRAITVRSTLAESYQYPALASDRAAWLQAFTTAGDRPGPSSAVLREGRRSYAPMPALHLDSEGVQRFWSTCKKHEHKP